MGPLFTSRSEWQADPHTSDRHYARTAVGHLVRAGLLGYLVLVGPIGAADSYWRSLPVLATFALSMSVIAPAAALLFRREWRTALREYGPKVSTAAT